MDRTLFNYISLDKEEENRQMVEVLQEMTPCIKCMVKPIIRTNPRNENYKLIRCPLCGYECGTYYDSVKHWNDCNRAHIRGDIDD